MTEGRKACKACQDVKQKCSFANRGGTAASSPELRLARLEELVEENRAAVLQAGLWQTRAALHHTSILALQVRLQVMEAERRGVQLPIGFDVEVDHRAAKTHALQLVTAAEYAEVTGSPLETVTANMFLAAKKRPPEQVPTEAGSSTGSGTAE